MTIRIAQMLLVATLLAANLAQVQADENARLHAYLDWADEHYDPAAEMLAVEFRGPGYHTTVPDGTLAHPTRQSLDYALALLERRAPGDAERAAAVVGKVLTLQDTDPASDFRGIWPWLLEEPVSQMAPPDRNWADFCGAKIAQMLHDHADRLPAGLVTRMRTSLGLAAEQIRRRNVGPGYTNICIMGAGVCAAAGEILGDAEMLAYGRERFQRMLASTERDGGFNEYNSPTYTPVALFECERTLHLVADAATLTAAERLRQIAWETIADSFHPGTQQWAGPQSRAYSDRIGGSLVGYLAEQTGQSIAAHPSVDDPDDARRYEVLPHLPCPEALRPRFAALPQDPLELRRTFLRGDSPESSTIGTTWLTADACLGTVNRGDFWTQRRGLLAYWRTADDPAVVLRLRFLHDGRDFASMGLRTEQRGPRALSVVYPLRGRGDWHPSLDRPEGGVFTAGDFRIRYELQGKGAVAEDLGGGRFALRAGGWQAVVHTLPGQFAGVPIAWEIGQESDRALVDGVCYAGPQRPFDFQALPEMLLATAVELQPVDGGAVSQAPTLSATAEGGQEAVWSAAEPPLAIPLPVR